MFADAGPRVFGLAPGVDFPAALVAGLRERLAGHPAEAMARVTLYVNTTRMQRRITQIMSAEGATFLPRLRLVTDLASAFPAPDVPPAVPKLRRKLQLSVLVSALLDKVPDLAPRSAIHGLSDSLLDLMAEMQGEGVLPDRVASLDVSQHSDHWARTRDFLTIIAPFFTMDQAPDAEGRQRLLAGRIAARWAAAPPQGPVIVAGSTGSRGTTALFMQAVARLPQGAIVLPGYDFDMPEQVWTGLDDALTSEDHPQYRFRKLMGLLDFGPRDIEEWHATAPPSPARNRVISLALRPAPVTDQWLSEGSKLQDIPRALDGLSLVEAATPRGEALAVALILREAAEQGRTAALISPDRTLTRQVAAALDRWGIRPDDSAGVPLGLSAPGRFLRHVVRLFGRPVTADVLLTVLKHPLTASAMARGAHLKLTRDLELTLREKGPAFPTGADLIAWAAAQKDTAALGWATALGGAIDAVSGLGQATFAVHVERTRTLAERLARGPSPEGTGGLWEKEAGRQALSFVETLLREAAHGGTLTPAEFRDMFDGLIAEGTVRDSTVVHPGVMIWGTIEARVQGADLVVLGGLNDGSWPKLPPPDPWLNRKMRQEAGLLLPERRIGLSAHDFQQAIGAPQVVLTRSLRSADAETVPSRWLNRLLNLLDGLPDQGGRVALDQMRTRGKIWLDRALAMDRPQPNPPPALMPARRPAPRPPVGARPESLSLTRVEALIRDPYAIYADKVLRLRPLRAIRPAPDARDRGTVVHEVLERFVRERPEGELRQAARARLLATTARVLGAQVPWPAERALWMARIDRAADHFLDIDCRDGSETILTEGRGELPLPGLRFTLFGTPDRIDRMPDGTLHLIDYKTGAPPTKEQQKSYAKQLHLAALMAAEGGFKDLGPQTVSRITYVGLGSAGKDESSEITDDELDGVRSGLAKLIGSYAVRAQGYTSRRAVFTERFPGDYDHLARYGEWEMTDAPAPEDVGDADE